MEQQTKYQGALKVTRNLFFICVRSSIGSLAEAGARACLGSVCSAEDLVWNARAIPAQESTIRFQTL